MKLSCVPNLEQATDVFDTVLERGQIAHEDPAIKKNIFNQLIINLLIN